MMTPLKDHLLIAMPTLQDPFFFRSVIYLCEHNEQGALGLVINQPLEMHLGDILKQMGLEADNLLIAQQVVFAGGPTHRERGFILHHSGPHFEHTIDISKDIALTTSPDILRAIAKHEGPRENLIALGYAHWEPHQLEKEMAENSWLYAKTTPDILFHVPIERRWRHAAELAGIDLDKLSDDVGHA